MEQRQDHCIAYRLFHAVDRLHLDPNMETGTGNGATTHIHPAKHRRWVLGELLRRSTPDTAHLFPTYLVPGNQR